MSEKDVVIITGSSGFIGSALIKKLASKFALIGFDTIASRVPPPQAESVCIDLTSDEAVKRAFERVQITYGEHIASVIHLATYYDLTGQPNPLYEAASLCRTNDLCESTSG
ncbi:NAD-dependent epimerase/dehydratase family protein [Legionella pneumophila]|uniref:NAD-dependent epimerase/dehydratase family protein n=1 Tax=Legionella pneumophila TaxID=446 RepID=UPI001A208682|nr:NAD-dependent epimerase/dehydratase family protein [Legionella pneumophila]HAT1860709.1 NAD-dependent epimerase/dehydratase family protein [Legionella pneumophila]HAU2155532.1 NAD-dependent epimerase/dehydratase family protein [Legionella pneumophila]